MQRLRGGMVWVTVMGSEWRDGPLKWGSGEEGTNEEENWWKVRGRRRRSGD